MMDLFKQYMRRGLYLCEVLKHNGFSLARSTPAAGRYGDNFPHRRSVILAAHFYVIRNEISYDTKMRLLS